MDGDLDLDVVGAAYAADEVGYFENTDGRMGIQTTVEDTPLTFNAANGNRVWISDVDAGENDLSLTITLTDPTAATISGGGFTETGPGTGIYTVSGLTVAQANTALDNVQFTPTNNTGPAGTFNTDISVTVNDQGGGGEQSVLAPTTVTITADDGDGGTAAQTFVLTVTNLDPIVDIDE